MDFARHQNLHTIIMLRDVIRKWWRCELSFADREGTVVEWAKEGFIPPPNDFCRLSLSSPEGMRRCQQSVQVLHEQFRGPRKLRHAASHECHLGFQIVGAPLYVHGEYQGFFFVEGFCRVAPSPAEAQRLKEKLREVHPAAPELDRAVERIPVFSAADLEKLTDLLEFSVDEISSFEDELSRKDERILNLSTELAQRYAFDNLIGTSPAIQQVFRLLEKVAQSEATVLIQGESGTGKELIARALHYNGPRKEQPLVVQSCAAFNESLLEVALFGQVKGAFPGAHRDQRGLLEAADGGTLYLDGIGELPVTLQVKLLRVFQEGTFTPVGGSVPRQVDVRFICATHRDLEEQVKAGGFREDLYYRVNVIRLVAPPLRERRDDLPLLVDHFLRKHQRSAPRRRVLSEEAQAALAAYGWPGNVRELENEIERLLVLGSDLEVLPAGLLSARIREAGRVGEPTLGALLGQGGNLNEAVERLEREMIGQGLVRTGNNKSQLARELGISRSNLILKIARYALEDPSSPPPEASA